jgi:transketolase
MANATTPETPETPAPVLDLAKLSETREAEFTQAEVNVPQEVKDFVDAAHTFWKSSPKKWRSVALGSEAAVKEAAKLARKWAKKTERTFRQKKVDDAGLLVYKVTDPASASGTETSEDSES